MTVKKLTVAAAIAVGIATCSFNTAMAACPCNERPIVTQDTCSSCEDLPVVTGEACPCEQEMPAPTCGCDIQPKCEPDPIPSCSLCPSTAKLSRADMRQVYSYPNAIYGTNNFVGTEKDSIYSAEGFSIDRNYTGLSANTMGTTISSDGNITGAASNIPCLNDTARQLGAPIVRDETNMDGNGCPISMGTANSIQAIKKTLTPLDLSPFANIPGVTGAAANMTQMFPDVPSNHWAACEIDKLAMNDVVVGYPNRLYKPYRNISRAEFATMLVKGFNKDDYSYAPEKLFSDVPTNHWANSAITVAVHQDLLKGYPNGKFMPNNNVTRVEALCAMSKAIPCDIDNCKAQEILSRYTDGKSIPEWAQIPIAKALDKGALENSPNPKKINPFAEATRADIAAMLQNIRVATGLDTNPVTANNDCPVCPLDKKAYVENEELVKIPTLKLKFKDQVSAKSSHVGQRFAAKTLEDVTINGELYPSGSNVYGKVVEVVRPSGCQKGALKLAFTEIENCGHRATLPKQILNADISKSNTPNIVSRIVTAPLTWSGQMLGVVGRTTGGMISSLGNSLEDVASGTGIALGEAFQGQFMASARSVGDVLYDTVKAPVDFTRTAVSGTIGLAQATGDEIGYLVDAKGSRISAINPKEHVTIAFGCNGR